MVDCLPKREGETEMVNKTENNKIVSEISKLNEHESTAVVNYISQLLSKRTSKSKEPKSNDDLIVSLADAYENQRARQVFEWERVRRQNVYRGA
jgi:hypothetical protein